MEIGLIGSPISGRDFPQGIGFQKLPNNKFSRGSLVVESPEIERLQGEVGNNHLVGISSHLEEGELPGRLLWKKTSNYDESLNGFPSPRFVFEFRDPDSRSDLLVTKTPKAVLNGFGDSSHNGIEGLNFLKKLDDRMVVEGRVAPDSNLSNSRGQLRDASLQQIDGMRSGMDIAREIDSLPYISCFAFETEKGLIGRPPPFFGIVAHSGSFLLAIDRKDLGVEIEDDGGERSGFHQEMTTESIVEVLEGGEASRSKPFQKLPQGRWIGISRKTGHKLEDPILFQQDVGCDPFQSKDNWVKDGQDGIADRITIVELLESNGLGESRTEFDLLEKLLQEV